MHNNICRITQQAWTRISSSRYEHALCKGYSLWYTQKSSISQSSRIAQCIRLSLDKSSRSLERFLHLSFTRQNVVSCRVNINEKRYHQNFSDLCTQNQQSHIIWLKGECFRFFSQCNTGILVKFLSLLGTFLIIWYLSEEKKLSCTLLVTGQCASKSDQEERTSEEKTVHLESDSLQNQRVKERKYQAQDGPITYTEAVEKTQLICKRKREELGTPGLVISVSVDGKQVYAEGFGYADLENELPIKPNSVLRIASISKSVTAIIVAKLWENGKLDLDKTVQTYVPNFPEKHFLGEKVDITVGQLLNHTSGIRHYKKDNDSDNLLEEPIATLLGTVNDASDMPFYCSGPNTKKGYDNTEGSYTRNESKKTSKGKKAKKKKEVYMAKSFSTTADALKLFKDDPLLCKPGSKFMYTTFGYTLLSADAESVADRPFAEQVTQTLSHMGLSHSYLDKHAPITYNRASFYQKNASGILVNAPYVDSSYKWGGGGLLSTVEDLARLGNILLYSAQHKEGDAGPPGYLKASTVSKFWTAPDSSIIPRYGLGFELLPEKEYYGMCGRHLFGAGHTGNAVGASSVMFILPRQGSLSPENNDTMKDKEVVDADDVSISQICSTNRTTMVNSCTNNECQLKPSTIPKDITNKECTYCCNDVNHIPRGVVVSIIVNINGIDLRPTAHSVARLFDNVEISSISSFS